MKTEIKLWGPEWLRGDKVLAFNTADLGWTLVPYGPLSQEKFMIVTLEHH